jgi:sulfate/thiosulfate transport system substrate-binding protein
MNLKIKTLAAAAMLVASSIASSQTLLNASYDVAREFYKDYNAAFIAHYKKTTGKDIKVDQAHGGFQRQARAVADGLEADVVTFNTTTDIEFLADKGVVAKPTGPSASRTTPRRPPRPCCSWCATATPRASRTGTT